jgi:hypothetical protein
MGGLSGISYPVAFVSILKEDSGKWCFGVFAGPVRKYAKRYSKVKPRVSAALTLQAGSNEQGHAGGLLVSIVA